MSEKAEHSDIVDLIQALEGDAEELDKTVMITDTGRSLVMDITKAIRCFANRLKAEQKGTDQ